MLHRICILQLVDVLRSISAILCSTSASTYWATDFGLPKQEPIPCQNPCQGNIKPGPTRGHPAILGQVSDIAAPLRDRSAHGAMARATGGALYRVGAGAAIDRSPTGGRERLSCRAWQARQTGRLAVSPGCRCYTEAVGTGRGVLGAGGGLAVLAGVGTFAAGGSSDHRPFILLSQGSYCCRRSGVASQTRGQWGRGPGARASGGGDTPKKLFDPHRGGLSVLDAAVSGLHRRSGSAGRGCGCG